VGDPGVDLVGQIPGGVDTLQRPSEFTAEVDGTEVAAFAVPVGVGEGATIVVVFGTSVDLVPWRDVVIRLLWALGLGVLLAAALAGSVSRFLGRRLEGLRRAASRLAGGDHTARVEVEGADEVTEVGVAFNEMAEQMEAARRREREFLVSVSHDLRTPLTTITGYAEAIGEERVGGSDLGRVADVLGRETRRLGRLVEDLMLLSRIEAREFSLRPEPVDLAAHLRGVAAGFRGRAEQAGITLDEDLAEMAPFTTDPDRVAQIVANLLENALRYTPDGGTVSLSAAPSGDGVRITVADTGPGIEAVDLDRIFERLYVAQRYRPVRPEGSGLGLAIVRELTLAMGGRAEVESEVGRGTAVSVVLPGAPPATPG
jgi:signal transduction histidine kinase